MKHTKNLKIKFAQIFFDDTPNTHNQKHKKLNTHKQFENKAQIQLKQLAHTIGSIFIRDAWDEPICRPPRSTLYSNTLLLL